MLHIIIVIILLIIFIYVFTRYTEGLVGSETCPDMLIQKGSKYLLYNSYNPESSTNPLVFDNLAQYADYINAENEKGNKCPILFVQQVLGAQGESTYKIRNDPVNPQDIDYKTKSLTSGSTETETPDTSSQSSITSVDEDKTKNKYKTPYSRQLYMDNLASSIVQNLSMKEVTNIDKLDLTKSILLTAQPTCTKTADDIKPLEFNGLTADPMQTNWGGPEFSTQLINKGYYSGNEIIKPTMTGSMI